MNNDGLQTLKDIGAQKIYEETHIPVEHVQAILYESFDGITKVHFMGFVSILQREYQVDLSALKEKGVAYYNEKTPSEVTSEDGIFIAAKKRRNFTIFYILIAMVIFITALYYTVEFANKNTGYHELLDNNIINDAKKNIHCVTVDKNISDEESSETTVETNSTKEVVTTIPTVKKEQAVEKSFKIIARSKVWLGYIDVQTNKKYQKTFTGVFDLDPTKEWLLIFGHGYIDVIINGEKKKFNSKKTLRLLYKDTEVKEVTVDEFKKLNRGNAW